MSSVDEMYSQAQKTSAVDAPRPDSSDVDAMYDEAMQSSSFKPKATREEDSSKESAAAAARGTANLFGFVPDVLSMAAMGIESLTGVDFAVPVRRNGEIEIGRISEAGFGDIVGTSQNLAGIMESMGINTQQDPDRSASGKWSDMAIELTVSGLPFIIKSAAMQTAKTATVKKATEEATKAATNQAKRAMATKAASAEIGAVAGASGMMQLAEDQGPTAQLVAAVAGDVIGRRATNAVSGLGEAAARSPGAVRNLKNKVVGRDPRARAGAEAAKAVPEPQALIDAIDANPGAQSLFDLPVGHTGELTRKVGGFPAGRASTINAARQSQIRTIDDMLANIGIEGQLDQLKLGARNAQGVISDMSKGRIASVNASASKAYVAVKNAIVGMDGENAAELAEKAKMAVTKNRDEVSSEISSRFNALSDQPLSRSHFAGVVANTKRKYKGAEVDIPKLSIIKEIHGDINNLLVSREPTQANFQGILRSISAIERNLGRADGVRGRYDMPTISRYLNNLEDSLLEAYGNSVGKTNKEMYKQARSDWRAYREKFDRTILGKLSQPDFKAMPNLSEFMATEAKGLSNLEHFISGAPGNEEIMRRYLMTQLVRGRESVPDAMFQSFLNDYAPMINRLGMADDVKTLQSTMRVVDDAAENLSSAMTEYLGEKSVFTLFTGTEPRFAVREMLSGADSVQKTKKIFAELRGKPAAINGLKGGIIADMIDAATVVSGGEAHYSGDLIRSWVKGNEEALLAVPGFTDETLRFFGDAATELDNTVQAITNPPSEMLLTPESPLFHFWARIAGVEIAGKTGVLSGTPGGSMQKASQISKMVVQGINKIQRLNEVEAILVKAVNGDLGDLKILLQKGMTEPEAKSFVQKMKDAGLGKMISVEDLVKGPAGKILPTKTPSLIGATGQATEEYENGSQ